MYEVPNLGKLVYGGFYGLRHAFNVACKHNSLDHPLMENIRNGNWLLDYICRRMEIMRSEASEELVYLIIIIIIINYKDNIL